RFFYDYLVRYTNAPTLVNDQFKDTEDLDGVFSGFTGVELGNGRHGRYDPGTWAYQSQDEIEKTWWGSKKKPHGGETDKPNSFAGQAGGRAKPQPPQDPTLKDPRCVFRILQKHYARYTPELVEQVCGTPRDVFLKVAETLYENAGPDRTG